MVESTLSTAPRTVVPAMTMPRRHMDGLGAGREIEDWIEKLAQRLRTHCGEAHGLQWEIDYAQHERSDGKTVMVWWQRTLIGTAVCARDVMNYAVVTIWEIAELPPLDEEPSADIAS